MGQTFRLEKGSALTYKEGDDNLKFPHLWNLNSTYEVGMIVFDGSDFYYLCIQDINTPNSVPLTNNTYWKKLSQTLSLNLNDLGDVEITNPIIGQGVKYDGTKWVNDNGSLSVINVTHSQLITLINNNNVIPGFYYRLEYTNVHNIDGTGDVNSGAIENLLLVGLTNNKISKKAFSESFPNDTIYYDVNNILAEDGVTSRPGFIERRISNDNNISTPFDFRTTKVRRYKQNNPLWTPSTSYIAKTVVINSNSVYGCIKNHTSTASFNNDRKKYWVKLFSLTSNVWGEYVIPGSISTFSNNQLGGFNFQYNVSDYNDYLVIQNPNDSFNIEIGDNIGFNATNKLGDILIGSGVKNLSISSGSAGITIGTGCSETKIGFDCKLVYLDSNNSNSEIVNSNEVVLGQLTNNNKVLGYTIGVTMSEYTKYNEIVNSIDCTFASNSKNNKITISINSHCLEEIESNEINQSNNVILNYSCKDNVIQGSNDISILDSSYRNEIIDSNTITISDGSSYNKILGSTDISLSTESNSNKIFGCNTITLGTHSNFNEITESSGIVIGDNVDECEVRVGSDGSSIGNGCSLVYLRNSGVVAVPSNSRDIKIQNVGSVIFSDLNSSCVSIYLTEGGNFTIGSACKYLGIKNSSSTISLGNGNTNIKIDNSGAINIGNNNKDLNIQSSGTFNLGNGNISLLIKSSSGFSIGNDNISLELLKVTNGSISNNNSNIRFKECVDCFVGSFNFNIELFSCNISGVGSNNNDVIFRSCSNNSQILNNCASITMQFSSNCTVNSNCSKITIESSSSVNVPPSATINKYWNCNSISYSNTPLVTSCDFKYMSSCSIQSNINGVLFNQPVSNKTFTAAFNNVVINIQTVNTEVLSTPKSDICYNSKSPNGKIWGLRSDNNGNLTNESLS